MSRFSPQLLDEIRSRVSISSVVGRHVQWDRRKTQASRGQYWACCPWHGEKTPSFHVDDAKGRFHCFGCKVSGDVFSFLTEKEGLSFPEAVGRLAQDAGIEIPKSSREDEERQKQRASLYDVMQMAQEFYQKQLASVRGAPGRAYVAHRSLSSEIVSTFGLGYAPDDRSALRSFLADAGVTMEQMIEAGVVVSGPDIPVAYDRFRDRLMFPIRDSKGRVIAFGGRALSKDNPAKYLNSPETPLFHKGHVLYNLDKARAPAHQAGKIIAVEGYIDVIAMHRADIPYSVAPLGTALTPEQLALLCQLAPEPTLCFDGDSAGIKAAYRAIETALPLLKVGHSLNFVILPDGQDPDELLKAKGPEAVQAAIGSTVSLFDMMWRQALAENDRSTPDRCAKFEADLYAKAGMITDGKIRAHYNRTIKNRCWELLYQRKPANGNGSHQPAKVDLLATLTSLEQRLAAQSAMYAEGCHDDE